MQQENKTKELGTAPIGSLLMKYAIPAVVAMTASSLYNMVDRIFIGHIPEVGTLSLGGLAVTFPVMNLSAAFGAMVGVGASTLMSIKLGQKDYKGAERTLRQPRHTQRDTRYRAWYHRTNFHPSASHLLRSK